MDHIRIMTIHFSSNLKLVDSFSRSKVADIGTTTEKYLLRLYFEFLVGIHFVKGLL